MKLIPDSPLLTQVLKKIANINIGSSIIDLIDKNVDIKDLNEKIDLNGKIEFKKSGDNLVIRSI